MYWSLDSVASQRNASTKRKRKKTERRKGRTNLKEISLFFTNHYVKVKEHLFVHRLHCVLLNHRYIAILYSICQCTVQNVCPNKNKKKKCKRRRYQWNCQTRRVLTRRVKEEWGATDSRGICGNWQVLSEDSFYQWRSCCAASHSVSRCGQSLELREAWFTSIGRKLVCVCIVQVIRLPDGLWATA